MLSGSTVYGSVFGLPGGAWALDAIAATPDKIFHSWLAPSTEVSVTGAERSLLTILDGDYALMNWGGTLVQVGWGDPTDEATAISQLEAFLARG